MCADSSTDMVSVGRVRPLRWPTRLLSERLLRAMAAHIHAGSLDIEAPDGVRIRHRGERPGPDGLLIINRWAALRRLFLSGDIGFAEAYVDGEWDSPDLPALVELVAINQDAFDEQLRGRLIHRLFNRLMHRRRANTEIGSQRNIIAHYDLGNEFYRTWLDNGMTYSSGIYPEAGSTLEAAQAVKQDRALALLDPQAGDRVLEIGIGWGAMIERLVGSCGVEATGVTLSPSQLAYAEKRLAARGLSADLSCRDYRRLEGTFDRIISIEMLEAVGREYWPVFFGKLRELLRPGGVAVLQVITILDESFENYCRYPDFIQRSVFPGGMLPSPSHLRREIEKANLALTHAETFGESYARTLEDWRHRFEAAWSTIAVLGFGPQFKRLWRYYLAYCEGGFRAGNIDVGLYRIERAA